MNSDYETYDFGTPLAFLRRRWPVIIGTAVVVAVVAFFVANVRSDKYSATATVLFRDPGLDQRIFDAPILFGGQGLLGGQNIPNGQTSIGLVGLDDVAEATARDLPPDLDLTADEVDDRIVVVGGGSSELVNITGETGDPDESAELANAYADAFLEIRVQADRDVYRRAYDSVQEQIDSLGPGLADSAEAARLRRQLHNLEALQLIQTGDTELVQPAEPPDEPIASKPSHTAILAGFAGLLLGLIAALIWDRYDRRLSTRREIERAYEAPIIGTVPELGDGDGKSEFAAIAARIANPPAGEPAPRVTLVLAPAAGMGASTVAAGLAAATGAKLVAADDGAEAPEIAASDGPIVVDGPALGEGTGALPLLGSADALVIVAGPGQRAFAAEALMRELQGRDVRVAGVVVNRASGRLWR